MKLWNSTIHCMKMCFTLQINAKHFAFILVLVLGLVLVFQLMHLNEILSLKSALSSDGLVDSAIDRELNERMKNFYDNRKNDHHHIHVGNVSFQSFTLILQTFNRTDLLMKLLNHYSAVPRLHKIIVVWNNLDEEPPGEMWARFSPHPVPVLFLKQKENKMRNRLKPFTEIETDAVLIMDDDLLASANDINFAFNIWQQFPDFIVGFVPRKHIASASGVYTYGSFELEKEPAALSSVPVYSMVLIGAAFARTKYLHMFDVLPTSVHNMIDETENCDDISFNVMVANYFRSRGSPMCPGIYVKPTDLRNLEKDAVSGYAGMWHHVDHMLERSYCLNKLALIYKGLPLEYSNIQITQFKPYSD